MPKRKPRQCKKFCDEEASMVKTISYDLTKSCYWSLFFKKNEAKNVWPKVLHHFETGHFLGCLEIAYHHSQFDEVDSIFFYTLKRPHGEPTKVGSEILQFIKPHIDVDSALASPQFVCKSHIGAHLHNLSINDGN